MTTIAYLAGSSEKVCYVMECSFNSRYGKYSFSCIGLGESQFCVRVEKKDEPAAPFAAEQHGHDQSQRDDVQRRLKLASILCLVFLVSEIAGGLNSGSLAILSDAAHLFSDLMGFVFAIAAGKMSSMPGSRNYASPYFAVVALLVDVGTTWTNGIIFVQFFHRPSDIVVGRLLRPFFRCAVWLFSVFSSRRRAFEGFCR